MIPHGERVADLAADRREQPGSVHVDLSNSAVPLPDEW